MVKIIKPGFYDTIEFETPNGDVVHPISAAERITGKSSAVRTTTRILQPWTREQEGDPLPTLPKTIIQTSDDIRSHIEQLQSE